MIIYTICLLLGIFLLGFYIGASGMHFMVNKIVKELETELALAKPSIAFIKGLVAKL